MARRSVNPGTSTRWSSGKVKVEDSWDCREDERSELVRYCSLDGFPKNWNDMADNSGECGEKGNTESKQGGGDERRGEGGGVDDEGDLDAKGKKS